MSFFIKGKRNKNSSGLVGGSSKRGGKKIRLGSRVTNGKKSDDEIDSESEDEKKVENDYKYSSESEVEETVQEKRLRLAHKYLEEIEKEEKRRLDLEEIDKDVIATRLKEDILEQSGRLRKQVAHLYSGVGAVVQLNCKEHARSVTCVAISNDNQYVFSVSEDLNIVKWSIPERKKLCVVKRGHEHGHTKKVMCLDVSSDGKFLVSGDAAAKLIVWDAAELKHIKTFTGHRAEITGLAFRKDTHQLFSSSIDKTIKVWNLDEMTYVETLFGHQCGVTSIDALARDRAVTSGGRDASIRIWKIPEESHLILNGHKESVDCVRLLNEDHIVSGGDAGNVCIWSSLKKKPVFTLPLAHGVDPNSNTPRWVVSIAAYTHTDMFATGSYDGVIHLYKCDEKLKSFQKLFQVEVEGNINCLRFTSDGNYLVAAVGKEHKSGRWHTVQQAKNSVLLIPLVKNNGLYVH